MEPAKQQRIKQNLTPYALLQAGLLLFLRAARVMADQLLRPVSPYEAWRRVASQP